MGVLNQLLARLPKPVQHSIREIARRLRDKVYAKQGTVKMTWGGYTLDVPKHHHLHELRKSQPYRDLCVGITAKFVCEKYTNATIVDIGANIGDTAAIIAQYSSAKMILVEASDYYGGILAKNAKQFPNEIEIQRVLVSDGKQVQGRLHYRCGTAFFEESPDSSSGTSRETRRLCDIADANTLFVKIDTDGFDTRIISAALDWLATQKPALLFENVIDNKDTLDTANKLLESLAEIGYRYFIYWDDAGFHVLSTASLAAAMDLNRYLFRLHESAYERGISNYDVLCLQSCDKDIFDAVTQHYAEM